MLQVSTNVGRYRDGRRCKPRDEGLAGGRAHSRKDSDHPGGAGGGRCAFPPFARGKAKDGAPELLRFDSLLIQQVS
jgi:hypothetical protein